MKSEKYDGLIRVDSIVGLQSDVVSVVQSIWKTILLNAYGSSPECIGWRFVLPYSFIFKVYIGVQMLRPVDNHCVLFGLNGSKVSGTHFIW